MISPAISLRIGPAWAGPIPEAWPVARLRVVARVYAGGTPDRANEAYWDGGEIPWIASGEVNQGLIRRPTAFITAEALGASSARWVPEGALLIALAGQGKTKGIVAQLGFEATCNQSLAAIVPSERIWPRYLFWWLTCHYTTIRNLAGGELRDGLNLEIVGDIPCPVPPLAEQRRIADLLDAETARIDALIAKKHRMVELLLLRFRWARLELLTAGSDRVQVPLRRLVMGAVGGAWGSEPGMDDVDVPCVRVADFERLRAEVGPHTPTIRSLSRTQVRRLALEPGDLLLEKSGGGDAQPVGCVVAYRGTVGAPVVCSNFIAVMRPASGMHPPYLRHVFAAVYDAGLSTPHIKQTTGIQNLDVGSFLSQRWSVAPGERQVTVAAAIDRELDRVAAARAALQRQIELLGERRDALITAAVTGQIPIAA